MARLGTDVVGDSLARGGGMTSREESIFCARVYIAQARAFRLRGSDTGWVMTLLRWASNHRRRASFGGWQRPLL